MQTSRVSRASIVIAIYADFIGHKVTYGDLIHARFFDDQYTQPPRYPAPPLFADQSAACLSKIPAIPSLVMAGRFLKCFPSPGENGVNIFSPENSRRTPPVSSIFLHPVIPVIPVISVI